MSSANGAEPAEIASLLEDAGIVRNRLKIRSAITNARSFLETQEEHGSFASYLWSWVDGVPVVNQPRTMAEVPARTDLSDQLSKDLKRRGFGFPGPKLIRRSSHRAMRCQAGGQVAQARGGRFSPRGHTRKMSCFAGPN